MAEARPGLARLLSAGKLAANFGRGKLDDQHQHDHRKDERADHRPAARVDALNQRRADAARLRRLVYTLPARERALLKLRYGLGGEYPATQQQTADKLGISRSYVSRLEKRALTRLMNAWRR